MSSPPDRSPAARPRRIDVRFKAWRAFLQAHSVVVSRVESMLQASCGLPFTWYDVLFQLAEAPEGRLRMHELADAVLLSRSGLTRSVDRIEAAGLVTRRAIPDDRRGTHVAITDAGREKLAAAFPVVRQAVLEHFAAHLSGEDVESLVRILGRIREGA
jgi:DNA-binding MarR family transcriptional regulator